MTAAAAGASSTSTWEYCLSAADELVLWDLARRAVFGGRFLDGDEVVRRQRQQLALAVPAEPSAQALLFGVAPLDQALVVGAAQVHSGQRAPVGTGVRLGQPHDPRSPVAGRLK